MREGGIECLSYHGHRRIKPPSGRRRDIVYLGAPPGCEFTNSMNTVVRIGTENERAVFLERERLSDKLEGSCCVCGKDDGITPWRLKE